MTEQQQIGNKTGHVPNECDCHKCQNMCRRAVCLGTPADILRLVNNGFIDRLQDTEWRAGLPAGIPAIDMVQPLYDTEKQQCTFFKDGKCELHALGLKPTEGVLADCKKTYVPGELPMTAHVALSWLKNSNQRTRLLVEFARFKKLFTFTQTN